jgi:hypothetical protein
MVAATASALLARAFAAATSVVRRLVWMYEPAARPALPMAMRATTANPTSFVTGSLLESTLSWMDARSEVGKRDRDGSGEVPEQGRSLLDPGGPDLLLIDEYVQAAGQGIGEQNTKAGLIARSSCPRLGCGGPPGDPSRVQAQGGRQARGLRALLNGQPRMFVEAKALGQNLEDRGGRIRSWGTPRSRVCAGRSALHLLGGLIRAQRLASG